MTSLSLLTTHARVLLTIADRPDARLRDIAAATGVSERWAHGIVSDLIDAGYVTKQRAGRRNRYEIEHDQPLGDDLVGHRTVGDVLAIMDRSDVTDSGARDG